MSIRVAIVEDDAGIRESLMLLLSEAPGFQASGAYASCEEALRELLRNPPDVVLMDIQLTRFSGIECVRRLKPALPGVQIVMLTSFENTELVFEALEAGANGYLLKRTAPAKIVEAIAEVHQGGAPMSSYIARKVVQSFQQRRLAAPVAAGLTPREEEVLHQVAAGYHNKEIGDRLGISIETVRVHLKNIYEKLHVGSRSEAVAKFLRPE
ncbi:MAG TPA: response regulator transcription factor [Candidatus Limnocylindria bacterium]|jgi:DNA-binding NarL/FixJ family response regulator|nr:response regulator transcription factor [Candidatus Limnocylindria bacterium]